MYKHLDPTILINLNLFTLYTCKKFYFPPEIKKIIFNLIIKDYYSEIIYYNIIENNLIYYEIRYCIKILINDGGLLHTNFINILNTLINTPISRKYNLHLWANFLQVLSIKINRLRFYHIIHHISFKSNEGKKLKLLLNFWLKLCQKFNFKIFFQTKKYSKYIRAKNIINMNSYDKYIISPIIIKPFSKNIWVDYDNAIMVLTNMFNTRFRN